MIKDSRGTPLIGASVIIKGTQVGTVTDLNGSFTLKVDNPSAILVTSYVGYLDEEVELSNRSEIEITMIEDITKLEEVVVVGYGTQKKRDLTGAIASVDQERLENIPATNLTASLQGAVAGVSISTPYGTPGGSSTILIRGLHSINASNDPLVVIDGIPGGSIDDINPVDIKSIDILKDAASTSIYGSRATNGVIIITTKSGSSNKPSLAYEGYYGFATPSKKVDLLSVDEYVAKRREIYRVTNNLSYEDGQALTVENILGTGNEMDMYNLGKSYDWQKELFQSAPMQNHSLSLNGGTENIQYYLSVGLIDQKGLIKNSSYQKQSVRANISGNITDWLKIGTNLFLVRGVQERVPSSVFMSAFQISPLGKMYLDETTKEQYTLHPMDPDVYIPNPFTEIEIKDERTNIKLLNSTFLELKLLKDFTYKLTANSILTFDINNAFTPPYTNQVLAFDKYENASITKNNSTFLNIENLLSYNKTLGDHTVAATVVFTSEKYMKDDFYGYANNFGTDYYEWHQLQAGDAATRKVTSGMTKTYLESMIGRLNYSYKGKYLAQFNIRKDRSSKFTKGNRDALFAGGSIGWRISEEAFMKKISAIDNMKLRLSYASTGNQDIDVKSIYNTGTTVFYTTGQDAAGQIVSGLTPSATKGNKALSWETSKQFNSGIDFSIFKGKLSGTVEYYKTWTSDLLLKQAISYFVGANDMMANIGKVENSGIEVALNSNVIRNRDFDWNVTLSFTSNRNTITELPDGKDDITNRWFIGQSIGVVYDYVFDGILQPGETPPDYMDNKVGIVGDGKTIVPGEAKVKDVGGWSTQPDGSTIRTKIPDGMIDEADKTVIGQTQPDWLGSMGMQFKYKNVDASFYFNYVHGTLRQIPFKISDRTHSLDIPYYTDENPNTQYGRPAWPSSINGTSRAGNEFGNLSYYQDGSYGRLQNVTIGYTLSNALLNKLSITSVRLYATGQNLLTFTDYIGYDPALEYRSDRNQTEARVDQLYGYPTTRNWVFGLKVSF